MTHSNWVSVLDWGSTDHSAVASRQREFWIPCFGQWNHWDSTQYLWTHRRLVVSIRFYMFLLSNHLTSSFRFLPSFGKIPKPTCACPLDGKVALMTYLCGLNASACLSDSILMLEQSETSANVKTPLLSHCQCRPLGFSAVSWNFDSSLSYHHTLGAPDTCMHGSDGYWHLNFQIDEQVWSEDFFVDPTVIRYQEQLFSSCSENKITPQYVLRHVEHTFQQPETPRRTTPS